MNSSQLTGILRAVVPAIVAYLAGKGILFDADTWNIIIGSLVSIIAAVWSAKVHTESSTVIAAAEVPGVSVRVGALASPEIKTIAADPTQPKVTSGV